MSNYLEARKSLGLSREKLSNLAKLAGIRVSPTSIKKLEDEGEKAIGTRGVSEEAAGYINYVLGLGDYDATDWSGVERGAPVIVSGEKGTFSFISADGDQVSVYGDKVQNFDASQVRLVAPSSLPSEENAHLFESRTRGDGGVYARQVLAYVTQNAGRSHGVGSIAHDLGLDNGIVSRTVAALVKSGKLSKVGRGVVVLGGMEAVAAPADEAAEAGDSVPSF